MPEPHDWAGKPAVSSNRQAPATVFGCVSARRFEFPDGSLYELIVPGAATGGSRCELDVTLAPAARTPAPHIHLQQHESCTVQEGALDVLVGREWRTLGAGDSVTIPPGTIHTFRNRSPQNVQFRSVLAPALGHEQYLERLYWLSAMDRISGRRDLTSALYSSLLLDAHRGDQVLAGAAARARVRALSGVARLLRMRLDRR